MPNHAQQKAPKTIKKVTETYLSNAGAYYLQRYAAGTEQFRTVMTRKIDRSCRAHSDQDKAVCLKMLDQVIQRFINLGYLNDDQYARSMVTSLLGRGVSHRAMMMKLQNRGLTVDQIQAAIHHYHEETGTSHASSEMKAALKLARKKKVGPYAIDEFDMNKALAAFARAGFSFDLTRTVLGMDKDSIPID